MVIPWSPPHPIYWFIMALLLSSSLLLSGRALRQHVQHVTTTGPPWVFLASAPCHGDISALPPRSTCQPLSHLFFFSLCILFKVGEWCIWTKPVRPALCCNNEVTMTLHCREQEGHMLFRMVGRVQSGRPNAHTHWHSREGQLTNNYCRALLYSNTIEEMVAFKVQVYVPFCRIFSESNLALTWTLNQLTSL